MFKFLLSFLCLASFAFSTYYIQNPVRVAVHGSASTSAGLCVNGDQHDRLLTSISQETTPLWWKSFPSAFTAEFVSDSQIDTVAKISANWDVVMLVPSGQYPTSYNNIGVQAATAVRDWVQAGGGLIVGADISFAVNSTALVPILQPVIPVKLGDTNASRCNYFYNGTYSDPATWYISNMTHPVTDGVWFYDIWPTSVYNSYSSKVAGTTLAKINGSTCPSRTRTTAGGSDALIIMENIGTGGGRSIFFSLPYCGQITYNAGSLRSDPPRKLLQNACVWAAKRDIVPAFTPTVSADTNASNHLEFSMMSLIVLALSLLFL